MNARVSMPAVAVTALGLGVAACGGGGGSDAKEAAQPAGPIKIWYSNNAAGDRLGQAGGRRLEHGAPRREGDRPGDPGRQDLRGGHRRRDHGGQRAVPDLQHLARPRCRSSRSRAAWCRSTTSPTATQLHRGPHRATAPSSTSRRTASFYQMPWKANPVMIFYNKKLFDGGRARPGEPAAGHLRRVPATPPGSSSHQGARTPRSSRRRSSEFFQSWFDFYPLFAAADRRQAARRGRQGHVRLPRRAGGRRTSGGRMYAREARPARRSTTVTRSPTARPPWRSSGRGRSRSTRTRSTGASCPVPTADGKPADQIYTFSDEKNDRHVHRLQEPRHCVGLPEVRHQRGAGRRSCSTLTGQMPMRRTCPTIYAELLRRATRSTSRSPTRPRAPSRCRTCPTRSRSGRRSATPGLEVGDLRQAATRTRR